MKYSVVTLSGPSASGKTTLIDLIVERYPNLAEKIKSTTSKVGRLEDYNKVSVEEFLRMIENDEFLEHTLYCGNYYGLPKNFIEGIADGKVGIKAFDIYGVEALKKIYGNKVFSIFLHRSTDRLIEEIKKRNVSDEEKEIRIANLDSEQENRFSPFIDLIIEVEENNLDAIVEQIVNAINN